jgi:predicted Zn finger-like uncharacterized protein
MIIVCPECSTKFNINSDRIPEAGAKVRCARCKHVFLAEKPADKVPAQPLFADESASTEEFTTASDDLSVGESGEADFNYDQFQELDSNQDRTENFTFGAADEQPEDNFSFTDQTEEAISPIEKIFAAENNEQRTETEPRAASPEEVAEAFSQEPESPAEPESPEQAVPEEKKSGPFASIIRVLLFLILGILIIAGVLIYMNGPDQLNQTIQQLFGQQTDRPVQTGQITLAKLEGRFIQNEQAGELFLIRGEAINNYAEPRAGIQVKGVIFDQNGKPLLQKTVFCGNPISENDLVSLSFLELEKIMGNQFGNELSNMKIDQGQAIPFDIIFKDLPKNLSEFSVKVTASKPATN